MADQGTSPIKIPEEVRWRIKLEDWKMAKERIDQLDQRVTSIRTTGIPIILVFLGMYGPYLILLAIVFLLLRIFQFGSGSDLSSAASIMMKSS